MKQNCVLEAWQKHESELRAYLKRQTGDVVEAEDLLQSTFIRAIAEGAGFCQLDNPRAWLFTVSRNQLMDHFRRQKKFIELADDVCHEEDEIEAVVSLSACLPKALQALDEEDRDIITRCDLEGMNQAEYARQKQLSLPGAKSRIQRARQRLKDRLSHNCQVRFDETGKVCCFTPRGAKGTSSK